MLADIYSDTELQSLDAHDCSRTISQSPEVALRAALFCQPIDVATDLAGNTTQTITNMTDYPRRSVDNTIDYIEDVLAAGISTVMLRIDSPAGVEHDATIEAQYDALHRIRSHFADTDLRIILDPFSIALNSDKTWGVKHDDALHYRKTAELFAKLTKRFSSDADYILTLGRFEREVDITHRTLAHLHASAKVASFSTNTETTNAYVYSDHGAYSATGQKINVANAHEMMLRALVDIYEGSELIVIKPAENLHILERLKTLLHTPSLLNDFLRADKTAMLVRNSPYLQGVLQDIIKNPDAFGSRIAAVSLGAYTVSGTYFLDKQSHARKGDDFLVSLLVERFSNIAGVLGERSAPGMIIDRNTYWFVTHFNATNS